MPGLGAAGSPAAFLAPLVLAWVLIALALKAALRWKAVDVPGERKVQERAVANLGGVAIVIAFSLTVLAATAVVLTGSGATLIGNPVLDGVATVLWVVLIVNALTFSTTWTGSRPASRPSPA